MSWKNKYSLILKQHFINIDISTDTKKIREIYKTIKIIPLNKIYVSEIKKASNIKYTLAYDMDDDRKKYDNWLFDLISKDKNSVPNDKKIIQHYGLKEYQNKDLGALIKLTNIIYKSSFISIDIRYCIEKMNIIYENYSNEYLNLHIYKDKKDDKHIDLDFINKIVLLLKTLSNKSYPVNLILILTNQKKYIIDKIKKITPFNTNSGYSIAVEEIVIWRYEEIYKVLIHELCHYYQIDGNLKSSFNKTKLLTFFNNTFNVEKNIDNFLESYTEIFALFVHTLLLSINNKEDFNKLINNEIKFSFLQVSKIINHFNGNTLKEIIDKKIFIDQSTSSVSYYIVKLGLLLNLPSLIKFWNTSGFIIENRSLEYIEIYKQSINSMINNYNNIFSYLIIFLKKNNCKCFTCTTLRMSLYQIK